MLTILQPVFDGEVLVSLYVEIALIVTDRKQKSDLRTDADCHSPGNRVELCRILGDKAIRRRGLPAFE